MVSRVIKSERQVDTANQRWLDCDDNGGKVEQEEVEKSRDQMSITKAGRGSREQSTSRLGKKRLCKVARTKPPAGKGFWRR